MTSTTCWTTWAWVATARNSGSQLQRNLREPSRSRQQARRSGYQAKPTTWQARSPTGLRAAPTPHRVAVLGRQPPHRNWASPEMPLARQQHDQSKGDKLKDARGP